MLNKGLKDYWLSLIKELALGPVPPGNASGLKYFENIEFKIPGEVWKEGFSISLEDLGYSGSGNKISQLTRNYYNPESVKSAREKLGIRVAKKSNYTSVMISMVGEKKDPRSQGHCMSSMVITHNPKNLLRGKKMSVAIDIFYRSTEIIRKFGADLIFLSTKVIPESLPPSLSLEDITEVRFHFSNVYFSPTFYPLLIPLLDARELFKGMKESGPRVTFRRCLRMLKSRGIDDMEHFAYAGEANMHKFLHRVIPGEDREEFLTWLKNTSEE